MIAVAFFFFFYRRPGINNSVLSDGVSLSVVHVFVFSFVHRLNWRMLTAC